MAKATYEFESGTQYGELIVDERVLYVPRGGQYEAITFDDEKLAVQAFNKAMMELFNPRHGWKIRAKRVGEARVPPKERMVGYVAEDSRATVDLAKDGHNLNGGYLIIDGDHLDDETLERVLTAHKDHVTHLFVYARSDATRALAAVARVGLPTTKTLIVDAYDETNTRQASCRVGNLAPALAAMPALTKLFVVGDMRLGKTLSHDALVHVTLVGNPLAREVIDAIAHGKLPKLERVQLGVSTEGELDEHILDESLVALVLEKGRALVELVIAGDVSCEEVLAQLVQSAKQLPPVVSVLGFVAEEDDVVEGVLALAAKKKDLRALGLPAGELGEESLAQLEEKLPGRVLELEAPFLPAAYDCDRYLARAPKSA